MRKVWMGLVILFLCAAWALPAAAAESAVADRIAQVVKMTPYDIASTSKTVVAAYNGIIEAAEAIGDATFTDTVISMLKNPAPTFLGVPEMDWQSYLCAGGAGAHHYYPGGLPVHTYVNLRHALNILDTYSSVYGANFDRDLVAAAVILHDVLKSYTNQYYPAFNEATGKWLSAPEVGGNGLFKAWGRYGLMGHHNEMLVAELAYREAPVILVASSHSHQDQYWDARTNSWLTEKDETWERTMEDGLKKLAQFPGGAEPSAWYLEEVLKPEYKTIEAGINLLSDSDWNMSQGKAGSWAANLFAAFAEKYGLAKDSKEYNIAQGWLFSRVDPTRIAAEWEAVAFDTEMGVQFIESVFADPTPYEIDPVEILSLP